MPSKILFTLSLIFTMLLGVNGTATAATLAAPPANTRLTYAVGTTDDMVMLDTNLSASERAQVDEYSIRVRINGQADRMFTVTSLPITLYNIEPGTRIHAYLTVKGDFGTSPEYDSGTYAQPKAGQQPTVTPGPTPTSTPSSSPSSSASPRSSSSNTPTASPSPTVTTPAASPAASNTPGTTAKSDRETMSNTDLVDFTQAHIPAIGIIALITFLLLGVFAAIRRKRH